MFLYLSGFFRSQVLRSYTTHNLCNKTNYKIIVILGIKKACNFMMILKISTCQMTKCTQASFKKNTLFNIKVTSEPA